MYMKLSMTLNKHRKLDLQHRNHHHNQYIRELLLSAELHRYKLGIVSTNCFLERAHKTREVHPKSRIVNMYIRNGGDGGAVPGGGALHPSRCRGRRHVRGRVSRTPLYNATTTTWSWCQSRTWCTSSESHIDSVFVCVCVCLCVCVRWISLRRFNTAPERFVPAVFWRCVFSVRFSLLNRFPGNVSVRCEWCGMMCCVSGNLSYEFN